MKDTIRLHAGDYTLQFISGGFEVNKAGRLLYFNRRPLYAFVKTRLSITEFYDAGYADVSMEANTVTAEGSLQTPAGSVLAFRDVYRCVGEGFRIERHVTVQKAVDDLGFATKLALVLAASEDVRAYDCLAPGAWYRQNQFTAPHVMGYDLDCEYFWRQETNFTLPMFAAQNRADGETVTLSRWAADVAMRDTTIMTSEHHVDRLFNIGAIGLSRPEAQTLNYLYYGYPLRKPIATKRQGLTLDYVYPGCDGQMPRRGETYNIDYMMKTKTMTRVYHPMEQGFTQDYSVAVDFGQYPDYYAMMKETWRNVYARLRAPLYEVDNEKHYHNCMRLLTELTQQYGDAWGLPFSCQLPALDVSSVSFQFGFVGQQPGIGYQLMRYGDLEGVADASEKGRNIISFWVRTAMTELGAPNVCYNPTMEGFEPYPLWTRMIADGLEAILDAYVHTQKQGEEHPDWLDFCRKAAGWLAHTQNPDGSFYRAYNSDGSMRMDSKANTTSVVRFLVQLYLVTGHEEYRQAALCAGQWCYDNVYQNMEYRGSTCDNMDILDNESGIYAMFAFQALYDLTGNEKWLQALIGAADFTETWTYAWSYPVRTLWAKHPFNKNNISGQSVITIGGGGGDVYMAACAFAYYRLYLITGDAHYLDFAEFIHNNTRQCNDVDGSVGYVLPGLGHESASFASQTLGGHYHWLPWCTYVEVEPTARLVDAFGAYDIAGAQRLAPEERQARNRIYEQYAPQRTEQKK